MTKDAIRTPEEIAAGNDRLRTTLVPLPGEKVLMTSGVQQSRYVRAVLHEIMTFSSFSAEDDPYGEHDFGSVEVAGTQYFFKIDYYDKNLEFGADQYREEFRRVLTTMRSDEY